MFAWLISDGLESSWRTFAHSGAVVNDKGGNFFIISHGCRWVVSCGGRGGRTAMQVGNGLWPQQFSERIFSVISKWLFNRRDKRLIELVIFIWQFWWVLRVLWIAIQFRPKKAFFAAPNSWWLRYMKSVASKDGKVTEQKICFHVSTLVKKSWLSNFRACTSEDASEVPKRHWWLFISALIPIPDQLHSLLWLLLRYL